MRFAFKILFILSLFVSVVVHAESTVDEIIAKAFQRGIQKPQYYQLTYKGQISHILGTYHWGISLEEFPADIISQVSQAQNLVVEILPSDRDMRRNVWCESNIEQCFLWMSPPHSGRKIKKKYREALSPFLNEGFLSRTSPYFEVHSPYLGWPALLTDGGSLDISLIRKAQSTGQKITWLEDGYLRQQADSFALSKGERPLRQPKLIDLAKDVYNGDLSWYQNQADEIADYRAGKIIMDSETSNAIAYRNRAWMNKLMLQLEDGSAFVAVGMGHLHGQQGLLKLLKEQGVDVLAYPFQQ